MHRHWMGLAAAAIAACAGTLTAQTTVFRITDHQIHALATDYSWGYWCGVKQPLGSFQDGLSIHEIAKSTYPVEVLRANPDYLLWVDEETQTFGIAEQPTGDFTGNVQNPGGQATFAEDGTIWYTYGGRAQDLPLDLFRSDAPYDFEQFTKMLDDYEAQGSSTTACVQVRDGKVMLTWRHGFSAGPNTTVRFRRYDIAQGFAQPELELDIGQGVVSPQYGDVGIEQLWTRFDPRFGYLFLNWQWYDSSVHRMGATPYLYSDDHGTTWRRADGTPLADLPLSYDETDATITPFDHIGELGGGTTDWMVADVGVSPAGTPWQTMPRGNATQDNWKVGFWRFDGAAWQVQNLAGSMLGNAKPHACGATRDYLVFAYSELNEPNLLKIRVSKDGGETWGDPIVADTIDPEDTICWVSFVQPSEGYPDDVARFFYGHFRTDGGIAGQRYQNSIRWIRMEIKDAQVLPPMGDLAGRDLVNVLSTWLQRLSPGPPEPIQPTVHQPRRNP